MNAEGWFFLNLKLVYTPWCKWLLNESRFILHKMFLGKYFSLCSHWGEKVQLRCLAELLRPLTRTCISQTRTNPTPNVCSPTAYRSVLTWHFEIVFHSNVEGRMCCGKCSEMRVGEGPCVSCEALYVHQMVAGPSCVPNRPLTISPHTWASRETPAFHPESCTRNWPRQRSAPRTSGWTDASAVLCTLAVLTLPL